MRTYITKDTAPSLPAEKFRFKDNPDIMLDKTFSGVSSWRDKLDRFMKNKGAVAGAVFIILLTLLSIIGPMVSGYSYDFIDLTHMNLPPRIQGLEKLGVFNGVEKGAFKYTGALEDVYHWFGTDAIGRDLFTRFCEGTKISLIVGIASALLDLIIGVTYGMIAGYFGGRADFFMMRVVEIIAGIPSLVVVTLLMMVLKPGLYTIILALMISGWTGMARNVRAHTLRAKQMEYVLAARTLGAGAPYIMLRQIFPNIFGSIIVLVMMSVPGGIFLESFLSFLGLGVPAPMSSLGSLISDGYKTLMIHPFQVAIPSVFFGLLIISLNLMADGLRDAFDPKQKTV
ncbi:MAG: ABC transporter permease [Clostridia bacterium]|nr:ABC transporter permease [Clostridia bacterium]MBR4443187.1 ABC transporter permease [Clostridia bacterium]